ncbi:MAG: hypothetical protein SVR08_12510 [Spirochaetota bacterium]|nr:hypothetical protein [Spirochaetota bacterium]
MKIRTEFNFVLPKDYIDENNNPKKIRGKMRLIKIKDIMDVYRDMRVKESSSFFYVVLLGKVITKLGEERVVNTKTIENLSSDNFSFLIDFLNEINHKILRSFPIKCSNCNNIYTGDLSIVGEL